jgi:hypothetical protein
MPPRPITARMDIRSDSNGNWKTLWLAVSGTLQRYCLSRF